eukprot:scaffold864_cov246-Chaetoceros_neogracile.AAC.6
MFIKRKPNQTEIKHNPNDLKETSRTEVQYYKQNPEKRHVQHSPPKLDPIQRIQRYHLTST